MVQRPKRPSVHVQHHRGKKPQCQRRHELDGMGGVVLEMEQGQRWQPLLRRQARPVAAYGATDGPQRREPHNNDGTDDGMLTADTGDLALWNTRNVRLQGAIPVTVALTSDGRTLVATFN